LTCGHTAWTSGSWPTTARYAPRVDRSKSKPGKPAGPGLALRSCSNRSHASIACCTWHRQTLACPGREGHAAEPRDTWLCQHTRRLPSVGGAPRAAIALRSCPTYPTTKGDESGNSAGSLVPPLPSAIPGPAIPPIPRPGSPSSTMGSP
jgi:hypothetical protein